MRSLVEGVYWQTAPLRRAALATSPARWGGTDANCPPTLAHVAGVAERIAAGLRPDRQPVRLLADRDRGDRA